MSGLAGLTVLAGCGSSGSSTGGATIGGVMALSQCSLGCSSTGCLRTDIATNEIIILQFTDNVDPSTVNSSSIQFRTASGQQPVGEFFVNGNQVEFLPTVLISGQQTFYGFSPGETYTMTIVGGENQNAVVRSTSGKAFAQQLSCTLVSNQGIIDHNGVPPRASLLQPNAGQLLNAPRDTLIRLEFNEIIDSTPFTAGNSPVIFTVRRTREAQGGGRECDVGSQPLTLAGSQRLDYQLDTSILTFTPAAELPPNVCIEVNVTNGVVDLSGKPAQPQTFQFLTEEVPLIEIPLTEEFNNDVFRDPDASASTWAGGVATFAKIGGDGRHGTFFVELGQDLGVVFGKRTYQINTDNTVIPAEQSVTGSPVAVTDGRFYFDTMVVPSDVRITFSGNNPPVFTVVGRLQIDGELNVAGQSLTTLPTNVVAVGQLGGLGGVFGGRGGQGGDKCLGVGSNPNFNGRNGQSARVRGGHAYATSANNTAGKGSQLFPTDGLSTSLIFGGTVVDYSPSAAAGGSGGGLRDVGEDGRVVTNNHPDPVLLVPPRLDAMGPSSVGGAAMQLFPFPPATGLQKSSDHFMIGGAGGGGAGSHACLTIALARVWSSGGAGGGGGGAIGLRAGDSLTVASTGSVIATGGSAASISGVTSSSSPAPGGGGSGGSVVVQSGRDAAISGLIDVRGGNGGVFNRSANGSPNQVPHSAAVEIRGGNGSPGFVRCEIPGSPTTALLATMQPAAVANNVGTLTETDDAVSFRSKFYSTGLLFGPEYARYEIHATVDGVPTVFSDDPAVSTVAATQGAPLRALWQAANINLLTNLPTETRPWRTSVRSVGGQTGIASDGLNGFRWQIIQDRTIAQVVTIDSVSVFYKVAE
ncbi:MAG: Ig-like domain-containing protein [Planctomycetes bacterium]|nr:Ig-like domain-containing protein [Planctomycetota bacterium]MCB9887898.1 Ig-like domain-containing protein [Planctomycetota bacterium]